MKTETMPRASYLDMLFENRNKQYGSYVLRRDANRIRMLSLFTVIGVFIVGVLISFWIKSSPAASSGSIIHDAFHDPVVMTPIVIPPPKSQPLPPEPTRQAPAAPTEKFVKPIITNDPIIQPEDILKDISTFKDKLAGPVHHEGVEGGIVIAKTKDLQGVNGNGILQVTDAGGGTADTSKIYQSVSVMPEFPGGRAALLRYLKSQLHYPEAAIDAQIKGTVLVEFIVNEQGGIEQAAVIKGVGGGCNQEALRVVNAMPRWSPGKVGNRAVKTRYKLPVTFQLHP